MLIKNIFLFLLVICALFGCDTGRNIQPPINACKGTEKNDKQYLKNSKYITAIDLYNKYSTKSSRIVMLGDSITNGVYWSELLDRKDVVCRGIGSDITFGALKRLSYVIKLKPKYVFIMLGVNDISLKIDINNTVCNYSHIIYELKKNGAQPIVQAVLFVGKQYPNAKYFNVEIERLNKRLKELANMQQVTFLDLNPFLTKEGFLKEEYTIDGIHLSGDAYVIWKEKIQETLPFRYKTFFYRKVF